MNRSKTAYFVTLTYAPETVPINKYGKKTLIPTRTHDIQIKKQEEGRKRVTKKWKSKLVDRSIQGFFKRLRQNHTREKETIEWLFNGLTPIDKIKFYAAGEYGEERHRPHYHAIIFNASMKTIEKSWTLGTTHIVKANEATISYLMKYLDKHHNNEKEQMKIPEFNIMSDGIGECYIEKNKAWHKQNIDILFVTNEKGIKIPMPKYYREKIFSDEERKDQVLIVTDLLEEKRIELIDELGHHEYNKKQNRLKYESERRFKKKIKKRIVD